MPTLEGDSETFTRVRVRFDESAFGEDWIACDAVRPLKSMVRGKSAAIIDALAEMVDSEGVWPIKAEPGPRNSVLYSVDPEEEQPADEQPDEN